MAKKKQTKSQELEGVSWDDFCPPKIHMLKSQPRYFRMYPYVELRGTYVKMRPLGEDPNPIWLALLY